MTNPFIEKAERQAKETQAKATLMEHLRSLTAMHNDMPPGEARDRVANRMAEAREAIKHYA